MDAKLDDFTDRLDHVRGHEHTPRGDVLGQAGVEVVLGAQANVQVDAESRVEPTPTVGGDVLDVGLHARPT